MTSRKTRRRDYRSSLQVRRARARLWEAVRCYAVLAACALFVAGGFVVAFELDARALQQESCVWVPE